MLLGMVQPMPGQGFDYLGMKIGRAYKHLKEFDSLVVDYCGSQPYTVTKQDDVVHGRHIVRCEFGLIDSDLPLSLADAVYALRSGLDQLAWQLSLLGNPTPSRDTMFPIHADQISRSEDLFKRKVWDIPCEAVTEIKSLQPYHRGGAYRDDPLWQLNELSNIDKHRLPVGRSNNASFYIEPTGWLRRELDNGVEFSWPLTMKNAVVFKPGIPELVFGDPIDAASNERVPVELTRHQIAEIYRDVREEAAP